MIKSRWLALDSSRGLAVLGMILVVSPGSWAHRFTELDHAAWNGWTIADMVMPLFLFCVGMALGMKVINPKSNNFDLRKATVRTGLLITIGLMLNLVEAGSFNNLRIPGVLQRIAVCYLLAFLIVSAVNKNGTNTIGVTVAFCVIILTNFLLMHGLSIGAEASGELTYRNNLTAIVDRSLFGVEHLWVWGKDNADAVVYDPDGLLSTVFATANVLAGVLVLFLKNKLNSITHLRSATLLIGFAVSSIVVAFTLDQQGILINKKLWSISFTLLSIGVCIFILLAFEYFHSLAITSNRVSNLSPLTVFGSNAILAFVVSTLLLIFSGTPFIPSESGSVGVQTYIFQTVSRFIQAPYAASLMCALLVCSLIYLILLPLHQKKIFLKL